MKLPLVLAVAVLSLAATPPPSPAPRTHAQLDVPADKGPQQVVVQTRTFAPGEASGWHVHHGIEVAYLISGEMEFRIAGGPPVRQRAGESVMVPRGAVHNGKSVGKVPARLVITLMVEKGPPLREVVDAPK